jgi:importin-7
MCGPKKQIKNKKRSATQFQLPTAACGAQVDPAAMQHLGQWLELIGAVIAKPLPEAEEPNAQPPGQPKTIEDRNAWPWWKLKKWAMQVLARWFHRYGMLA